MKSISRQPKSYLLGDYRLETDSQLLSRAGQRVHLPKRPFQVLLYLVEHRDQVVSRNDLLDLFWDGKDVYDDSLRKCLGTVRKALGDSSAQPRFIETRYAGGYRFIGPVVELERRPAATVEIVKTRGVKILVEEEIHDSGETTGTYPSEVSSAIAETSAIAVLQTHRPEPGSTTRVLTLPATLSQLSRSVVIVILVAVTLTLGTMIILRDRASSNFRSVEQSPAARSIAVLPLRNLTGDANDEYLSDGLTDSLITELGRINNLKVIARASSFKFKGQDSDAREVGRRLGVANILEGSIRKSGDRIRVNLRLVSTSDGRVVWTGDSFDRALSDIFTVQDEISCAVAESLRVVLCGEQPHQRYTENAAAYQAYLKGRYHWNKRSPDGIRKSIEYYEQALQLDSNYALAYAGLAESYVQGVWHVPFSPAEAVPKAREAALKAIALDDALAEAHTALASAYQMEWNWAAAGRELQRALGASPQSARAHHVQAFHFLLTGRNDEAVAAIIRARDLDPLNLIVNADVGLIFLSVRRTDEALQQLSKALELDPNFVQTRQYFSLAYQLHGNEKEAATEYLKALEMAKSPREKVAAYRQAYALEGLNGILRQELKDLLAQQTRKNSVAPVQVATLYGLLGHKEEAFRWLERAYQEHSPEIAVLKCRPFLDPLRNDPRFGDLLRRSGLPS